MHVITVGYQTKTDSLPGPPHNYTQTKENILQQPNHTYTRTVIKLTVDDCDNSRPIDNGVLY